MPLPTRPDNTDPIRAMRLKTLLFVAVLALAAAIGAGWYAFERAAVPMPDGPLRVIVPKGANVRSVASLVWRRAGVRRRGEELAEARRDLVRWSRVVLGHAMAGVHGVEAQNLCILAGLLLEAAEARRETRGVHWRSDFPVRDDAAFRVQVEQRADAPTRLVPWADDAPEVSW